MSTISGIGMGGVQNVPRLDGGDKFLSADALIIQLEAQMESLDGDIKTAAGMQKADLARKKALQDTYTAGMKHNPPKNEQEWNENIQGMRAAAAQLPEGDAERDVINHKIDQIEQQYPKELSDVERMVMRIGGMPIEPHRRYPDGDHHEWDNSMQGFKDEAENINGNAELRMISIQDLMSKRQTAVQLTTSIMQKIDQTAENISQKI